jgi:hypothetical protein
MRKHHQLEELQSLNATRQPRKGITMKQALQGLQGRLGSQRLAADRVDASVNWCDDGKGKKK